MVHLKPVCHLPIHIHLHYTYRVKVKVKLGLGVVSAKVECTIYSESGTVPSPALFQNHVLAGVTLFEVYVDLRR